MTVCHWLRWRLYHTLTRQLELRFLLFTRPGARYQVTMTLWCPVAIFFLLSDWEVTSPGDSKRLFLTSPSPATVLSLPPVPFPDLKRSLVYTLCRGCEP
jgi:hypothetical protein